MSKIQAEIKAMRENTERFKAQAEALSKALDESKRDFETKAKALEAKLASQARMAKGTDDVTREARALTASEVAGSVEKHSTSELMHAIEDLIRERPMTLQELHDATYTPTVGPVGFHKQTICNILVKLQRERRGVVNLANQHRALWFIPNQEILDRLRKVSS